MVLQTALAELIESRSKTSVDCAALGVSSALVNHWRIGEQRPMRPAQPLLKWPGCCSAGLTSSPIGWNAQEDQDPEHRSRLERRRPPMTGAAKSGGRRMLLWRRNRNNAHNG